MKKKYPKTPDKKVSGILIRESYAREYTYQYKGYTVRENPSVSIFKQSREFKEAKRKAYAEWNSEYKKKGKRQPSSETLDGALELAKRIRTKGFDKVYISLEWSISI